MTLGNARPRLRSRRCSPMIRSRFRAWQAFFDPGVDGPGLYSQHPADGLDAVALGIHGYSHVFHPPDGRHSFELFFGTAGSLATDPSRAVDILAVPDEGTASTRAYQREQGPRGLRGEPLSFRWRGPPPSNDHKVIIEYTEES